VSDTENVVDVIVIGGGNAGLSAALAAAERGRRVTLLERGAADDAGGNSYYTAGATRIVHGGFADLKSVVVDDERHDRTEVPPYSAADYAADMEKVTEGRNDKELTEVLVAESSQTLKWLAAKGVRYRLMYERQSYERPDGSFLFWGGLHVGNVDGGVGLIHDETKAALAAGVDLRYGCRVTDLVMEGDAIVGVRYATADEVERELRAESVVIAAGGFEANSAMREKYLGPGWGNAKLRGTPNNTGELIEKAIGLGASRGGDWSTCHSTAWDAWTPENESNRELTNRLTRQSYPLGIYVNANGQRFVDEGADFRNYTYAKYGSVILKQPGSIAYQVFDATLRPRLRTEEYEMPGVGVAVADSIPALATALGIDPNALTSTIDEFNSAIDRSALYDPTIKDGRRVDLDPPKSNWSWPIEVAPFYAYPVTCGITFTFGGLKGDTHGRVLRDDGSVISGLFAVGEAMGGLFSGNYPGGSGLAAGMVFGRRAGSIA
jgi:tricarballylate dehydrogenase